MSDKISTNIRNQIKYSVCDHVSGDVRFHVRDQVWTEVWENVSGRVWIRVRGVMDMSDIYWTIS